MYGYSVMYGQVIYAKILLVSLSSYYLVFCSHIVIYSVPFFPAAGFRSLFDIGMRLFPTLSSTTKQPFFCFWHLVKSHLSAMH